MNRSVRAHARTATSQAAAVACASVLAWMPVPSSADDEEFATFKVTDIEGRVEVRALGEDLSTSSAGSVSSQRQADLRTEVFLSTRSYVYHPNLLSLEVGFGPIYQQARYRSDFADTSGHRSLYDLTARATFLRDKPYTAALYYEHLNPYVSVGPAQVLLQENERYGVDLALLAPATPVPLRLDASRQRSRGSSSQLSIDDQVDQIGLVADASLAGAGTVQFRVRDMRLDSQSGSALLPIQRTRSDLQSAALDTRAVFGEREQYQFLNLLTYETQHYELGANVPPDRDAARALFDLRARWSEAVQTHATYHFDRDVQGSLRRTTHRGELGANYTPNASLSTTLSVNGEETRSTPFSLSLRGAAASARYRAALAQGAVEAGYSARREDREQTAAAATASVIGERLVLTGTDFIPLSRERVIGASIVVSNELRTQTYVEGQDYTVSVLGTRTRIQRIVGGGITQDPPVVVVDYAYEVGGTFAYSQLDQSLNLGWSLGNRVSVYVRHFDSRPKLTSGVPLLTLNTVRSTTVGARADLPLGALFLVGAGVEHENRRETILPFKRDAADAYVQLDEAFIGAGGIRVGVRRTKVDYDFSSFDVDLTGYEAHYWVRLPENIELIADANVESDRGAAIERRREYAALRARWQFRKLSLSASATRVRETQGVVTTTRTLGQLLLRRDF